MFKAKNENTRRTTLATFWCFYSQLLTYFTTFSNASIVYFEKVNVNWDKTD